MIACFAWIVLLAPPSPVISHEGDTYVLDSAKLNAWMDDFETLSRSARIIPNFQNGEQTGFKLVGIRPSSLWASLGIRNGDVVTHVHGRTLTSPDKALAAYTAPRVRPRRA